MLTFKQTINLTFGHNKVGSKFADQSTRDQVDKIIDQVHLSKTNPNVSFKLIHVKKLVINM